MQFTLHFPSNIIFEEDGIEKLGEKAIEYGNKCLIVTGKKSAQKSGALDKVTESLKKANIQFVVFDKASGEPNCEIVDEVRELADKEEVKFIIGLGGGSPMDVAKAAAGLWGQNLETVKYVNKEPFQYSGIPFVAVPTTSGTGSEVTLNSVLYNPQTGNKKSLANPKFQASLSIIDPSLTYTMSSKLTAAVGMDALTHAVESYTSL
ncbi:MAG: iron-containing alcohol dehydrogenase, partial [Clostridia bacterium]|nr:iron-containing alcohol dehydrogenase [Clostridia bacterium]